MTLISSPSNPTPVTTHPISPTFPSAPPGSHFQPRQEFVQQSSHQSSFALLVFSSNNVIRLSNFPQPFVAALKSLLDSIVGLRSFRENAEHKICEIVLVGKPWSNTKSLSTEIIIVQVFSVILAHGYSFLSKLDYGREHMDRLSLAFSKPTTLPISSSAQSNPHLVPFALSFPSSTTLRVVCSPLHATPAILQSVRGAWPRGVSSERKLGENCYEFKLKGYSWFQDDTFNEDAIAHTLTLLTALEKYSWTLMTSISLSPTHSRNKDLWVFSGPDATSSISNDIIVQSSSPIYLGSPLKPTMHEPIVDHVQEGSGDSEGSGPPIDDDDVQKKTYPHKTISHRDVNNSLNSLQRIADSSTTRGKHHTRAVSDTTAMTRRKPPPQADFDQKFPESRISPPNQTTENISMTGPSTVLYSSSSQSHPPDEATRPVAKGLETTNQPSGMIFDVPQLHSLEPVSEVGTPDHKDEGVYHSTPTRDDRAVKPPPSPSSSPSLLPPTPDVFSPPLLAPTAFRPRPHTPTLYNYHDSAFSDRSGQSFEVPIKWIPPRENTMENEAASRPKERTSPSAFPRSPIDSRLSFSTSRTSTTGPLPPGAWEDSPMTETDDPLSRAEHRTPRQSTERLPLRTTDFSSPVDPIIHQNSPASMEPHQNEIVAHSPRVVIPELSDDLVHSCPNAGARRKSEAGIVGVMSPPTASELPQRETNEKGSHVPPEDQGVTKYEDENTQEKSERIKEKPKEGWVLVNVAPDTPPGSPPVAPTNSTPTAAAIAARTTQANEIPTPEPGTTHVPLSATQIIAAADAISASDSPPTDQAESSVSPPGKGSKPSPLDEVLSPSSRRFSDKSTFGKIFSRRGGLGSQKLRSIDWEKEGNGGDKSKSPEKEKGTLKKHGRVLSTIRSRKRLSVD